MKWGLKGGISIHADSGPPRYVLWCCGCICHELLTFIQIGCGHTVWLNMHRKVSFHNFVRFWDVDISSHLKIYKIVKEYLVDLMTNQWKIEELHNIYSRHNFYHSYFDHPYFQFPPNSSSWHSGALLRTKQSPLYLH